uniref:Uncharacterized protein n=1 Tax=Solanum tuberosum TaxID=4113 RepID=M1BJS8_SOLTU
MGQPRAAATVRRIRERERKRHSRVGLDVAGFRDGFGSRFEVLGLVVVHVLLEEEENV